MLGIVVGQIQTLTSHFDTTIEKLEDITNTHRDTFEKEWSLKFDSGMASNDSQMDEIRKEHEKISHDVIALKKMYLDSKKSTVNGGGGKGDPEAMVAMKRANASQIQRAQGTFSNPKEAWRKEKDGPLTVH